MCCDTAIVTIVIPARGSLVYDHLLLGDLSGIQLHLSVSSFADQHFLLASSVIPTPGRNSSRECAYPGCLNGRGNIQGRWTRPDLSLQPEFEDCG